MDSLLTLKNGKNESLSNYSKRYWKIYNKIEECLEELAVASYKLRLTHGERLLGRSDAQPVDRSLGLYILSQNIRSARG